MCSYQMPYVEYPSSDLMDMFSYQMPYLEHPSSDLMGMYSYKVPYLEHPSSGKFINEHINSFGVDATEDFKEYTLRDYYCWLKTYCCCFGVDATEDFKEYTLRDYYCWLKTYCCCFGFYPGLLAPYISLRDKDLQESKDPQVMRIEQYFLMTDYSLWEVILNGDSHIPTRVIDGVVQPVAPTTAEQWLARKNELKARGTLLIALPNKHQSKFNIHKDAKTLLEAIEKQFGGNKETMKMESLNPQVVAAAKLHILNPNKFNLWKMRIEQYFFMTNYSLWEVILNGDFALPTRIIDGAVQIVAPTIAEQRLAKKNKLKARVTFLMALSDKHQLKFNIHKDTKSLMEAIEKRFGADLEEQSLDDLFNNLKIYEAEVKGSSPSSQNTQNITFVFSNNTDSTNELVTAVPSITTASSKATISTLPNVDSLSDAVIYSFFASQSNSPQLDNEDLKKGHFARECRSPRDNRNKDTPRRTVPVEVSTSNDLVSECSSSSSGSDNEVAPCSKACSKPYATLQTHYDNLIVEFRKSPFDLLSYKTGLESVEARLVVYQQNETVFEEDIKLLTLEVMFRDNALEELRKKFEKERNELKLTLDKFQTSSKNLKLHDHDSDNTVPKNPKNDRSKLGNGLGPQKTLSFLFDVQGNPQQALKDKSVIDSGCSRHMTRNISFLSDLKEIDKGYVAFGGNPKSDTECVVLSSDYKLHNENHVLLRVPRGNNMYNVDLKNGVPSGGLTCFFAKATLDESNLWHKRLRHINFKTMNKVVKGNLVKGLPLKIFKNNHTCVACQKEKQHKASCKSKPANSIGQPLQRLHMDLFGPTFVKSLKKKSYCLVVTDDYSRFSWVFSLAIKDETSGILKTFIAGIENQINHKVKIIRCDNRSEFKNHDLNQFCGMKGIKRKFSVARTPQQNGVAERKNRTLIEAAKTMECFDRKADEGFLVGYSVNSKALRVFNRLGPKWLLDVYTFSMSINYQPVVTGNQANYNAGIKENLDARKVRKETVSAQQYVLLSLWSTSSQDLQNTDDDVADAVFDGKENENDVHVSANVSNKDLRAEFEEFSFNNTNRVNVVSAPVNADGPNSTNSTNSFNTASPSVNAVSPNFRIARKSSFVDPSKYPDDADMPELEDIIYSDDEEDVGAKADLSNLETNTPISPIPTIRVHKDHHVDQIIGDLNLALQTRSMPRMVKEQGGLHQINDEDFHTYLPKDKRAIGSKWVFRNKKDERAIVIQNKARIVAQGYTIEEGIDYDEVFAPVAKIEAIRLFLAYASFISDRYQKKFVFIDVKSASTPIETEKPLHKDPDGADVDVHIYSTNESVSVVPSVSAPSTKHPASILPNVDNLSDAVIYCFFANGHADHESQEVSSEDWKESRSQWNDFYRV
nr:hypothetical protein [Tanacetum cinerariifolium]